MNKQNAFNQIRKSLFKRTRLIFKSDAKINHGDKCFGTYELKIAEMISYILSVVIFLVVSDIVGQLPIICDEHKFLMMNI